MVDTSSIKSFPLRSEIDLSEFQKKTTRNKVSIAGLSGETNGLNKPLIRLYFWGGSSQGDEVDIPKTYSPPVWEGVSGRLFSQMSFFTQ